jgi:plastocyanin
MNQTLFYVFGIVLIVSAIGISAIGLRFENFPPTRSVLAGVVLYFAVLVAGTAVFAVLNARDEQAEREAEQAAETTTTTEASAGGTTSTTPSGGGGGGSTVKLAADPTQIAYTTDSLKAKAGNLTIDFNNPNPAIPHDVCVDSSTGGQLGCSDQVTNGSSTLALDNLKPGKYTFFCSVDGHEQAGMKGTLAVQ